MSYTIANDAAPNAITPFPRGTDVRWEAEDRMMWNVQEHTLEQEQLVYAVSWIPKLGVWRRFLKARHKARG